MIHIIKGSTRVEHKIITPADGNICLSKSMEKRLVALGIAEYVNEPPAMTADAEPEPAPEAVPESPAESDEPEPEESDEDLNELTVAELREKAEELGLDVRSVRKKADLIAMILEEMESGEDGEAPVFSAEDPVE